MGIAKTNRKILIRNIPKTDSLGLLLSTIGLNVWFGFKTASIKQIVFPL